jgi:DNA repair exonuclease SbcCD nuclease subunit
MTRLLHLADVHLDAPLGGFRREANARRRELLDAFRGLPDVVSEGAVDAVLIAGDLFDGPQPSESTLLAVRETVRRLVENGVSVFAVPGNHDAHALNPTLYQESLAGATVFEGPRFDAVTVKIGETPLHVYGVAYDAAEEADPLSTFERVEGEGLHIALIHGAVPGAPHWEGGTALRLPIESLAALGVDYIALGDYHRFRPPAEFVLDGEEIPACYSGSFAAVDLSEVGPKGYVFVDLVEGQGAAVGFHSSGVREVHRAEPFDVSSFDSEAAAADALGDQVPKSIIPVTTLIGEPSFPLDADRIRATLDERFGCATVADQTRFFDSGRVEELASENTIAGHVARLGLERIESVPTDEDRAAVEQGLRIALRLMEVA